VTAVFRVITYTVSEILSQSNFAVLTANSGSEALEIAMLIPPDILITDRLMPGMDGLDLGLAIRCVAPDCKVIVSSGRLLSPENIRQANLAGLDFVTLAKPVHPSRLLACIASLLDARGSRKPVMDLPGTAMPQISENTM
jgi:DNA-binding response OmpR family regulator